MQSIGVIDATGGEFRPKDSLTRAEAATMLYKTWQFGFILSTPQQKQLKSNWCWAACAYIMAEYRHSQSMSQTLIADEVKNGENVEASYTELAHGATWATYNYIYHRGEDVLTSSAIVENIQKYRPVTLLNGYYNNSGDWTGHFMVCIGFAKNFSDTSNPHLFIYDVANNNYYWMTYNEYKNGTGKYYAGYNYVYSVIST